MSDCPVAIYLSRHCKTAWNLEGRLQGTMDLPLCEAGVTEAEANAAAIRALGVGRIVCSTARRAHQTAQLYGAALGLPVLPTLKLRELDHGVWEGRKVKDLLVCPDAAYARWLADPGSIAIPGGGESVQAAQQRAADALREAAFSSRGEPVLIVGHKHINALLMCALLNEPLTRFGTHVVEDTLPRLVPAYALPNH
jgi:broad specificity phosphatase PhoE